MSVWADIIERDGHEAAVWSGPLTYEESVDHCLARILPGLNDDAGLTVLDYGCGVGRITAPLHAALWALVVGYDPEPEMVAEARLRHPHLTFWSEVASCITVDNIVCMLVLQHLPKPEQTELLAEFRRLLNPGGRVVAQVAIGDDDVPLSRQWRESEVAGLFEGAGLSVLQIEGDDLFPTWKWVYACQ